MRYMSSSSLTTPSTHRVPLTPDAALKHALTPQRSLHFFTITATFPIVILILVLLFTHSRVWTLQLIAMAGGSISLVGFGKLLYDITMDLAGFPNYHLPVWAVLYLVIYLVFGFTFLFFGMHIQSPGTMFSGFVCCDKKTAFIDALYVSLCIFVGSAPSGNITYRTQTIRFLTLVESILGMFVSGVILTKFVSSRLN